MAAFQNLIDKAKNITGSNPSPPSSLPTPQNAHDQVCEHEQIKAVNTVSEKNESKGTGKRRGRPRKSQDRKKLVPIKVFCSHEEADKFKEYCDRIGIPASVVLRGYIQKLIQQGDNQ